MRINAGRKSMIFKVGKFVPNQEKFKFGYATGCRKNE